MGSKFFIFLSRLLLVMTNWAILDKFSDFGLKIDKNRKNAQKL